MSDGARERGGKPQNSQKSFGGQVSLPNRQQPGYRWKQDSFPHGTNRGLGGTISGLYYNLQELQCKPCNIENHDVITQETVRISAEAAATAATTTLQKTAISEEARISDGDAKRWKDPSKPSNMYLVLPSYTEPQSKAINKLIADEKAKLCSNSLFKQVFANIDFRIAFANSKNIKKLIVRTKV